MDTGQKLEPKGGCGLWEETGMGAGEWAGVGLQTSARRQEEAKAGAFISLQAPPRRPSPKSSVSWFHNNTKYFYVYLVQDKPPKYQKDSEPRELYLMSENGL